VEQIKRLLSEHRNHINRNITSKSVITEHRIEHNHDFDSNNLVRVLDEERSYNKRLISKAIYINKQKKIK